MLPFSNRLSALSLPRQKLLASAESYKRRHKPSHIVELMRAKESLGRLREADNRLIPNLKGHPVTASKKSRSKESKVHHNIPLHAGASDVS
jgi:hypothetical protein